MIRPTWLTSTCFPRTAGDGNQYFTNLDLVREAALYGDIPFINVIQAASLSETHRVPTGEESRYLGYTTLAYGGQGIMHFTYWAYSDFYGGISEFEDIEWTEEFDAQARQWRPVSGGSRAEVNLVASGGLLLRLQAER